MVLLAKGGRELIFLALFVPLICWLTALRSETLTPFNKYSILALLVLSGFFFQFGFGLMASGAPDWKEQLVATSPIVTTAMAYYLIKVIPTA